MAQVKLNEGGRPLVETAFNFTHFHVYDTVERPDEIDVLDEMAFAETEFALSADFSLNTGNNAQVGLTLSGKGEVLCREQMQAISGYYAATLTAMARESSGQYHLQPL